MHLHIHNTEQHKAHFQGRPGKQYKSAILLFYSVAKLTALESDFFFFCYCCYVQGLFTTMTIVPCTAFETRSFTREKDQSSHNLKLIFTGQLGQCNRSFLEMRGLSQSSFFRPSPLCSLLTPQQSIPPQPFSHQF